MAESRKTDARRTKRTHGVSSPLPEGHKPRPDPRRNTGRTKGQRAGRATKQGGPVATEPKKKSQ